MPASEIDKGLADGDAQESARWNSCAHLDTVLNLRPKVDSSGDYGGLHQER
jgi:hypothetical protein